LREYDPAKSYRHPSAAAMQAELAMIRAAYARRGPQNRKRKAPSTAGDYTAAVLACLLVAGAIVLVLLWAANLRIPHRASLGAATALRGASPALSGFPRIG
jgi:hypothetical protein